jgi:5S rRNA maturation endonuclease (ribonuclease M5)
MLNISWWNCPTNFQNLLFLSKGLIQISSNAITLQIELKLLKLANKLLKVIILT